MIPYWITSREEMQSLPSGWYIIEHKRGDRDIVEKDCGDFWFCGEPWTPGNFTATGVKVYSMPVNINPDNEAP